MDAQEAARLARLDALARRPDRRWNGRPIVRRRITGPPPVEPLFPVTPFDPTSGCAHNRPISPGSRLVCMICHGSGRDAQLRGELRADAEAEWRRRHAMDGRALLQRLGKLSPAPDRN